MKKQLTLATSDFERFRKPTRREKFLAEMNTVVPWTELCVLIEPCYPKATSAGGRPPVGLERMLRMHCLQLWFDLSDPAVEEALYDSLAMRAFVGIDLGSEPVPDESTLMRFRHLLEHNGLGEKIFEEVGRVLLSRGLKVSKGTIVDATIIAAPSSTKNAEGSRDPQMHQTKQGKQWYFGMKVHVRVDARSKVIHSVVTTPANTADCKVLGDLLHGHETRVYGDQAYKGQRQIIRAKAPKAKDFTHRLQVEARLRRCDPGEEPHEVAHPGTGGTLYRGDQARVRVHQGALSRSGQERQPGIRHHSAGQHFSRSLHGPGRSASAVGKRGRKTSMPLPNHPENRSDRDESIFPAFGQPKNARLCGRSLSIRGLVVPVNGRGLEANDGR